MKAVILAGGKGTRLADISQGKPKSLMQIGDRAVIDHQLEMLDFYVYPLQKCPLKK